MAHPQDNSRINDDVNERIAYEVSTATAPLEAELATAQAAVTTAQAGKASAEKALADHMATHTTTPPVEPPTATGTKYGMSATPGNFESGYTQQITVPGAACAYYYGQNPRYAEFDGIPADHDLWLQTKATTKADYVATLASMPATRKGKVFFHYFNEPEDQIERGDFTMAEWQQRTDWLYQAIAESGKTYVIPSVEIMYWDITLTNKGNPAPARNYNNYLRPGCKAVGVSAYAEKKVSNGHEVAATSATNMPNVIKAFSTKVGKRVSIITGWAIDTAYLTDGVSLDNRRTWTKAACTNLVATGVVDHIMWFNVAWSNGDYRIETDPKGVGSQPNLQTIWNALRA